MAYTDRHIPVLIFPTTARILLPFQEVVKVVEYRSPRRAADRMVGLWPRGLTSLLP
jgi:hypothetical protein